MALIKSMPGNVSLESLLREICTLMAIRALGLPAGLFSDVAPKVQAAVTLLAVLVAERSEMAVNGHQRIQMITSGNGNRSEGVAVFARIRRDFRTSGSVLTPARGTFSFRVLVS